MKISGLETERLLLRHWSEDDYPAFARINSDPVVMEYYPDILTRAESDAMVSRFENLISKRGWGFWALELKEEHSFIGFVGLHEPDYTFPVTPCVEIGWRLNKNYWQKGYATEAAARVLDFAFEEIKLNEVYSFASKINEKSIAVMQRLKMKNTGILFPHPVVPENSPLSEHVLYKIDQQRWMEFQ